MPIYKGKQITMEEWYEKFPQAKPKPPKTVEECKREREERIDDRRHATIENFADELDIPLLVQSMLSGDEEAKDLVLAFRACADHIKSMMIHDRCNYYGETDDRFRDETCAERAEREEREVLCNGGVTPGGNDDEDDS